MNIMDEFHPGISRQGLPSTLEQLLQFTGGPVWDGNLIGKQGRDELVEEGLVERARGYNFLTAKGVTVLVTLGFLRP